MCWTIFDTSYLGKNQRALFRILKDAGCFYEGCGWTWRSHSAIIRVLSSLVERGLVYTETAVINGSWKKIYLPNL
jgi:hypothetical protein